MTLTDLRPSGRSP